MKWSYAKWAVLALFCLCATACAGMTAAEVTTGLATGAGAIAAIGQAVSPYLPPDKAAEFVQAATTAQTVVDAVANGLGVVAESLQQTQADLAAEKAAHASDVDLGTAVGLTTLAGGGSVAASRLLSALKHGKVQPAAQPA